MNKIKAAEMTKISVTGSKKDLQSVIEKLHDLELLDINEYDGELETGDPFEEAEELSELLVDVRSLLSRLPEVKSEETKDLEEVEDKVDQLASRVEEINDEISHIESELSQLKDQRKFFKKLRGSGLNYEDLQPSDNLSVFVGEIDREEFERNAPDRYYEIFEGEEVSAVFYYTKFEDEFENALQEAKIEELTVPETELEGPISEIYQKLEDRKDKLRGQRDKKEEELENIAGEWRASLEESEEFLSENVEKAEAPLKFATTENAFIARGWIPSGTYRQVEEELAEVTDGRIHIEEEQGEEPPVKHDNPGPVKSFESLTDLMSVPKHNEIDPSIVIFLTFPLFFGFMIGDAGYGLTSLAVFYAGYRMVPGAKDIFKSLMWASVATFVFGLAFGDAFGFIIFGSESVLTQITGIGLFSQIPVLFHRAHHLGQVFNIAALIGIVHINAGYLIGFYNEHVRHGFKEAFLEKGSWLLLEVAVALWFFVGAKAGAPVLVISVILLYLGEGIEGIVEIPSLLSNVLSYLRIFGVSVAAVALAQVVNSIAAPLFNMGGFLGYTLGISFLVLGHFFNTFIKIMEGFLQGIRLHYVEMFSKFYEGGGKKYAPFGK